MSKTEGVRRSIRLKEWGLYVDTVKSPSKEYIAGTDGTLMDDEYQLRTDNMGFICTGVDLDVVKAWRKVVLLGDSFVESLFAKENKRFAAQFESMLFLHGHNWQV